MVRKSLSKIDPTLMTGTGIGLDNILQSFSQSILGYSGALSRFATNLDLINTNVAFLESRISALEAKLTQITQNPQTPENPVSSPEKELSPADRALLDSISYVDSTLIPKVEVLFQKVVTFANDVIFQSRVIFSDPDMAGQVSMVPGETTVVITFERPYPGVPVITLTSVGHFHVATISESSRYGFTIEIEHPASRPLLFNWVALMVKGAASGQTKAPPPKSPSVIPAEPTMPIVSGEIIPDLLPADPISGDPTPVIPSETIIPEIPGVPAIDTQTGENTPAS